MTFDGLVFMFVYPIESAMATDLNKKKKNEIKRIVLASSEMKIESSYHYVS